MNDILDSINTLNSEACIMTAKLKDVDDVDWIKIMSDNITEDGDLLNLAEDTGILFIPVEDKGVFIFTGDEMIFAGKKRVLTEKLSFLKLEYDNTTFTASVVMSLLINGNRCKAEYALSELIFKSFSLTNLSFKEYTAAFHVECPENGWKTHLYDMQTKEDFKFIPFGDSDVIILADNGQSIFVFADDLIVYSGHKELLMNLGHFLEINKDEVIVSFQESKLRFANECLIEVC